MWTGRLLNSSPPGPPCPDCPPPSLPYADIYGPKVSALFSIVGSCLILREIMHDMKQSKATAISRAILSMSLGDMIFSFGWLLTTWPSPRDLDYLHNTNHGDTQTCTTQGFIIQFGYMASLASNMFLALFYVLVIKYGWKEHQLAGIEQRFQVFAWGLAVITAIVPIPLKMYNNLLRVCWIVSSPINCIESWLPFDGPPCERGDNALLANIILARIPLWLGLVMSAICMITIYLTALKLENRNARYGASNFRSSIRSTTSSDVEPGAANTPSRRESFSRRESYTGTNRMRSRIIAANSIFYMAAFVATYLLMTISLIIFMSTGIWHFGLETYAWCLVPLQGFFNFLVFARKRDMQTPEGAFVRKLLCCACERKPWRRPFSSRPDHHESENPSSNSAKQPALCEEVEIAFGREGEHERESIEEECMESFCSSRIPAEALLAHTDSRPAMPCMREGEVDQVAPPGGKHNSMAHVRVEDTISVPHKDSTTPPEVPNSDRTNIPMNNISA